VQDTAEFYEIRAGRSEGWVWANIALHEATGSFLCSGDYGSFCHQWPPAYRVVSLKKFLAGVDRSYFMEKTRGACWKVFSVEKTLECLRETILEHRRHEGLDKHAAREAWDDLRSAEEWDLGYGTNATHFYHIIDALPSVMKAIGPDMMDIARTEPSSECVGFWERVWPKFLEQIEPEIADEAA